MKRVGIDLGTTNTVIACDGEVISLPSEESAILPSVVAFPPTGATLVGRIARRRRPIDPKNTVFSSKRLIGRRWDSTDTTRFRKRYPLELVEGDYGAPAFVTRAGLFSPVDVAGIILTELCRQAGLEPGELHAVIAVPAVFADFQRAATIAAGRRAGFAAVDIVDEPTATAAAFVTPATTTPKHVAAYDFGGGTFDVAIIDCSGQNFRTLGYAGDLYLGGDEIDAALAKWAAAEVLANHRWDLTSSPELEARLVAECEQAKIRLCDCGQTSIDLTRVDLAFPNAAAGLELGREVLARLALELVQRSFILCDQALADAGLKAQQIDQVVLAGGTTLLPMVRRGVEAYFGKPPSHHLNPMEVVAMGASRLAL